MPRITRWSRRQPAHRGETGDKKEVEHPEHIQICLHIIEARRLCWSYHLSGTSYVVMAYGKRKRRTSVRRNMMEPYYGETFVFETNKTIGELEQSSIWLAVMETRCCGPTRLLGEANIDLGAIWAQPNHQVNEKWVQLYLPSKSAEFVGFLKIGVAIFYKGNVDLIQMHCKTIGENYANNRQSSSGEQQRANYQFVIYAAFGLGVGDRRYAKSPNTFVRVTFCGLTGKTAIQHNDHNPVYSEQISMVELFPNANQRVCFDVCMPDGLITRVLGTTYLNLDWISHNGDNGYLPTFGPSLLHMYTYGTSSFTHETDGPYHRGALLVSLKTIVPFDKQKFRSVSVEPVAPVKLDALWAWEGFCIYCPILEVSTIDCWLEGKCGVCITIGEMNNHYDIGEKTDEEEFCAMLSEIRARKLNCLDQDLSKSSSMYMNLSKGYPVLQLAAKLPDFRFRIYRNNIIDRIVLGLTEIIENVERRLKDNKCDFLNNMMEELHNATESAACGAQKFLSAVKTEELIGRPTQLDMNQLALMEEEIKNIHKKIFDLPSYDRCSYGGVTKKDVKVTLGELKCIVDHLKGLINKNPHGWPDITVWVISGGARVGYHKVSPADILYSSVREQNGRYAGAVQTIYLKPLKCCKHPNGPCYCIAAKIELQIWMGLYKEYYAFEDSLPHDYKIKVRGYDLFLKANPMIFECRVYIYNTRLNSVETSKSEVYIRVHVSNRLFETKSQHKSLLLTWNQMLKARLELYTSQEKVAANPPEVTVDVLENPSPGKENFIGRVNIRPIVDERLFYEKVPKLRNFELYRGAEHAGDILMAVQLLQIPEKLLQTVSYTSAAEERYDTNKEFNKYIDSYEIESLPTCMLPQTATYKIDIYWWGLRDLTTTRKPCVILQINNLTVKSDVVFEKKSNCNFSYGQSSHTFEAPLTEPYCPPMSIRLYDSNTFGRTQLLGSNVVKNPNKFLVKWMSETERERLLKGKSISSPIFFQGFTIFLNQVCSISNFRCGRYTT